MEADALTRQIAADHELNPNANLSELYDPAKEGGVVTDSVISIAKKYRETRGTPAQKKRAAFDEFFRSSILIDSVYMPSYLNKMRARLLQVKQHGLDEQDQKELRRCTQQELQPFFAFGEDNNRRNYLEGGKSLSSDFYLPLSPNASRAILGLEQEFSQAIDLICETAADQQPGTDTHFSERPMNLVTANPNSKKLIMG